MRFLVDESTGGTICDGIVLLRLDDERAKSKIEVLKRLLHSHTDHLPDHFVVVTEKSVRFAKQ
jgi:hypothetical protein